MIVTKLSTAVALLALASAYPVTEQKGYSYVTKHIHPIKDYYTSAGYGSSEEYGQDTSEGSYGHDEGYNAYNFGDDEQHQDYHHYPQYKYEYGVNDPHTGDHKNVWEHRDGDVVKGGYSFYQPDGVLRVVEYTADDKNGFNAVVKKIGEAKHPQDYEHTEQKFELYGKGYGGKDYGHGHGYSYNSLSQ